MGVAGPAIFPGRASPTAAQRPPSFVMIVAADFGYGDLACYGANSIATPRTPDGTI
jgi:hypothetical protein